MNRYGAVLLMIAFIVLAGTSISLTQTESRLSQQSCDQLDKADAKMNEAYARILREYANDQEFIAKIKAAQQAWLAFRDAEMEALYPKADKLAAYGTVYPMCHCLELQSLTEDRTKQLRRWLDGIREGEVCAGSLKVSQ